MPLLSSSETPKQPEPLRRNNLEGGGRKVLMELGCMSVFTRTSHVGDLLLPAAARQEQRWQPCSNGMMCMAPEQCWVTACAGNDCRLEPPVIPNCLEQAVLELNKP